MKSVLTPVPLSAGAPADQAVHPNECLSALADGDPRALQAACSAWRDDERARQAWHSYHLIGDVMRSEDLATSAERDARFLAGLRARLALEPVVLAPVEAPVQVRRRRPWLIPAATAASVAVVAGVLVLTRVGAPGGTGGAPLLATAPGAVGQPLQTVSVDGQGVMRDARLEELIRQHQASRGGLAVPLPGAMRPQAVSAER